MNDHQFIFGAVAVLIILYLARVLRRWNAEAANPFDFRDLVMENGRASKGAIVMFGAFFATTWLVIYYALTGKLTEGYFMAYCAAWVAPVVARVIGGRDAPATPPGPCP